MRLIDADAIPYTMLYKENWLKGTGMEAQGVFKSDIDNMPAIEERKAGKWLETDDGYDGTYYDCSVCGESWTTIEGTPWENGMNFCPNCGARMMATKGGSDYETN